MEVILLERIERLGQIGDVVNVKPGFARNFLLPQNKALRATPANRQVFEQQRADIEATSLKHRGEAEKVAEKLDGVTVILIRQASDSGQLYGSVNSRDVAEAVTEAGYAVERRQIILEHAIKMLGLHPIRVSLHPEVAVTVTANVAKTEEEAAVQLERGGALGQRELEAEEDAADAARRAAEEALAIADDKSTVADAAEGLVEDEVESKILSQVSDAADEAVEMPGTGGDESPADDGETQNEDEAGTD